MICGVTPRSLRDSTEHWRLHRSHTSQCTYCHVALPTRAMLPPIKPQDAGSTLLMTNESHNALDVVAVTDLLGGRSAPIPRVCPDWPPSLMAHRCRSITAM